MEFDSHIVVKEAFDSSHSHTNYRKVVEIDYYSLGNVIVYGSWRSGLSRWVHTQSSQVQILHSQQFITFAKLVRIIVTRG